MENDYEIRIAAVNAVAALYNANARGSINPNYGYVYGAAKSTYDLISDAKLIVSYIMTGN
jgi:hypothetical protein